MASPLYPQLEVVQTGPRRDDWMVCTFDGEKDYGIEPIPGGTKFGVGGANPDFTKGTTYCLDVLGALKDPNRNGPAKNHWTLIDTASEVRPYCCPTAVLLPDGKVLIGQGLNRSPNCNVNGQPCIYEEKEGLHFRCSIR
jgi:hypothetical protein